MQQTSGSLPRANTHGSRQHHEHYPILSLVSTVMRVTKLDEGERQRENRKAFSP